MTKLYFMKGNKGNRKGLLKLTNEEMIQKKRRNQARKLIIKFPKQKYKH